MKFLDTDCTLTFEKYDNGRTALVLMVADSDECMTVCTVNVPHVRLEPDEVLIKDYSENEGVLALLESEGIVERTGRNVPSGYVNLPVCRLLVKEH